MCASNLSVCFTLAGSTVNHSLLFGIVLTSAYGLSGYGDAASLHSGCLSLGSGPASLPGADPHFPADHLSLRSDPAAVF